MNLMDWEDGILKFHHIGFEVKDLESSKENFINHLGFHTEEYLELNGENLLFLVNDSIRIELIENDCIEDEGLSQMHICFETDCLEFLDAWGLSIIEGPMLMENGWTSVFVEGKNSETIEFLKRI